MKIKVIMLKVQNIKFLFLVLWVALLAGCSSRPTNVAESKKQPVIYPDYVGVTIPVGIAPLDFSMADDGFDRVDVEMKGARGGSLHANGAYADFDIDEWHSLLEANRGARLTVTVCARKDGQWTRFSDFSIFVSADALDEWGITYRRIPPSYKIYSRMGLFQRDLSNFDESPLLLNTQAPGACLNCHTANRTNPDQYVYHVRGEHGATVIHNAQFAPNKQGHLSDADVELLRARNDSLGGSMVYPYWHPGGRYCAFSTNSTSQMFHTAGPKRIEVYDSSSDVFVYDTQTHQILQDTLIMRKYWAENTPAFSPDGRWLYFTTARRQVYPTDYDQEKYSLCRVSFDAATGRLGQQVDTLISAAATGKSATWPRPSYDGRHLVYTQTNYGYFSVWHPEADLWLLDLQTLQTSPLDKLNSPRAESLHTWSGNSRWMLFTSRRDDGLYTRVYFTHIDSQGKATKPFMLPQRNPKRFYQQSFYSYNTPDFSSRRIEADARKMGKLIEKDERTATKIKKMNAE